MAEISNHPVLLHKLTQLRKASTRSKVFRELMREITFYLGYEATRNLPLRDVKIKTPVAAAQGKKLDCKVALIPILRSGLGMTEAMLELIPHAQVYHLGMYRERRSLVPVIYYDKLPREHPCDIAVVLEPVVATANSIVAAISLLKTAYKPKKIILLCILASESGLAILKEEHPEVTVHVAAVDKHLSEEGEMLPGLGDVGDRLFGTPAAFNPDVIGQDSDEDPESPRAKKAKFQ